MRDDSSLPRLILNDKATFHISGKVNGHDVRIWELENPQEILKHYRDFPKHNVLCGVLRNVYESFLRKTQFQDKLILNTVNVFPPINDNFENFIFQQDGAPPHWHRSVRSFKQNSTSTLDRPHMTPRLSTIPVAIKIIRPYTPRLSLTGFNQRYCFCATIGD